METASITVKYVNEPKGASFSGSVKDSSGQYWGVKKAMLSQFAANQTYTIEFDTVTRNGNQYKNIHRIVPSQQSAYAPVIGNAKYGQADMGTAERIFVCGAINATLSNGLIDPLKLTTQEGVTLVNHWRHVWRNTFAKAQTDSEMGDEIPNFD